MELFKINDMTTIMTNVGDMDSYEKEACVFGVRHNILEQATENNVLTLRGIHWLIEMKCVYDFDGRKLWL